MTEATIELIEKKDKFTDKKLGLEYSKEKSIIRVWAPSREEVILCIYDDYNTLSRNEYEMTKSSDGVFEYILEGDYENKFYTFLIENNEVVDPYAFASNANSKRAAIIDLEKSNPEGFLEHKIPYNDRDKAIICEAHIADISIDKTSGVKHRGLFLGACEKNTKYNDVKTVIDHFEELGITHIHLLPVTDYLIVDETKPLSKYPDNYNWGYAQELYNNIEGSFSTNPNDPYSRIIEFKKLVQGYHEKGISVVLDVVYNHTFRTFDSPFNEIEPGYYYRQDENGYFSNGSGCGNELASERPMVRKFIIESLCYLAKEYKVDGFRFDLMALIDMDTVLELKRELEKINPNILIYGEPWMALASPLEYNQQVIIGSQKNKGFSIFNPFFRDALKGDNDGVIRGYIQGEYYNKKSIEEGIAGSIGLDNKPSSFANPLESINYFNAHDNLIFNDKLIKTQIDEKIIPDLTYMTFSIVMTSQGLPFFHAGNSFMRTKYMNENSYNASAKINGIDWSLKEKNIDLFNKIKNLIKLRKDLGIFNMKTKEEVLERISFYENLSEYIIAYKIKDINNDYLIIHNVSEHDETLELNQFTNKKDLNLIWNNNFVNENVQNIIINKYSTNIYKI